MSDINTRVLPSKGPWRANGGLDVYTQGRTKKEAFEMLKDAIESLAEEQDFFEVIPGRGEHFEICSKVEKHLCSI